MIWFNKNESLRSDAHRVILVSKKSDSFDDTEFNAWVSDVSASDKQLIAHNEKLMSIMEEEGCRPGQCTCSASLHNNTNPQVE